MGIRRENSHTTQEKFKWWVQERILLMDTQSRCNERV